MTPGKTITTVPMPSTPVYDVPAAPTINNEAVAAGVGVAVGVAIVVMFVCIVHFVARSRAPVMRQSAYAQAAAAAEAEEGRAGVDRGGEEMDRMVPDEDRHSSRFPEDDQGTPSGPPRRLHGAIPPTPTSARDTADDIDRFGRSGRASAGPYDEYSRPGSARAGSYGGEEPPRSPASLRGATDSSSPAAVNVTRTPQAQPEAGITPYRRGAGIYNNDEEF